MNREKNRRKKKKEEKGEEGKIALPRDFRLVFWFLSTFNHNTPDRCCGLEGLTRPSRPLISAQWAEGEHGVWCC